MDRFPRSNESIVQPRAGLQTFMAQVYGWMTCGLLLTAFVAWYSANNENLMMYIFSSWCLFFQVLCISSARRSPPRSLCSIRR